MSPDPADVARERAEKIEGLIRRAEMHEGRATPTDVLAANNLRLRALCLHHRVPGAS